MTLTVLAYRSGAPGALRYAFGILLLFDFTLIITFAALLMLEIGSLFRRRKQGGPLQRRLIIFFLLMAVIPTLLVAIFSTLTVNFGIDGWFSGQVRNAVNSSYETAIAYQDEHHRSLLRDGEQVYQDVVGQVKTSDNQSRGELREYLTNAVDLVPNISNAFIIDGEAEIFSRGKQSYKFNYVQPNPRQLERAFKGEVVVIEDWGHDQFRYLRRIEPLGQNRYLYLTRPVDGEILALLDQTEETVSFYQNLDKDRIRFITLYGVVFLLVALITVALAISAALYLADRLTRPINQLVRAASRISAGELDVKVPVAETNDELSVLSRSFNVMTRDVREKRDELVKAGEKSERERQRFNSVLEGVSSGVIGIDQNNKITFINPAAIAILSKGRNAKNTNIQIGKIAPEFLPYIEEARSGHLETVQKQLTLIRGGQQGTLFLRIARRNEEEGLIISFDDVSNLVQAQRMAAWGDVARRIAHEIKNPLTPIRLAAERMQRRYGKEIKDEKFNELTDVIVRQTDDLRRIVDEFSRFSKMPDPKMQEGDLIQSLKEAILLRKESSSADIRYQGLDHAKSLFDGTLMGQAFGNLIKNASEAIEARHASGDNHQGIIQIESKYIKNGDADFLEIKIIDNGIGLPEDASRLFEPYVTYKDTGTGLGLPIVNKIIEDHGGNLQLQKRNDGQMGACAIITLPIERE